MPKPNYQREKRLKDLARQRKQEEKRQKKAQKSLETEDPGELLVEGSEAVQASPEENLAEPN